MATILASATAIAVLTMPAIAAPAAPDDTSLAVFAGGSVSPGEFAAAWQELVPSNRPAGPDRVAQKRAFLRNIVDRKLLALEASRVPLVLTPDEDAQIERTRRQLIQNELFARLTAGLPPPTSEELERFRRQRAQLAEVRFITFEEWEVAQSWRRRLLTGTPMSTLDELIQRGGPGAPQTEDFRWLAFEQIPDTLAQVIWAMRPGQVSEVHSFAGHPVLLHLRSYQPRPLGSEQSTELSLEDDYRRRQQDRIRQRIRVELAERARREFVNDGMDVLLAGYLKLPPRNDVDSVTGAPVMRTNLPLPVFTAADTGFIVARTRHGELNLVSYLRYWQRLPGYARPDVRERSVLEAAVDRVALESELLVLAGEQGADTSPAIEDELQHMREGFGLDHYFAANFQARVEPDEAALRAYFAAKPGHYDDPELLEGLMMVLDRRALADSLLAAVRGGHSFPDLARAHSIHGESAGRGGKTGVIRRGTNTNVGLEDAMFATPVGALQGPESTPEGWVIWRVDRHDAGKKRTFEEAREWVERDYRIVESDRMLAEHLVQLRKQAHVRYFDERVTETLGAGGAWGD
jgi:hypothetical protein